MSSNITMDDIRARLKDILMEKCGLKRNQVGDNTSFEVDLRVQMTEFLDLLGFIEEEFKVSISKETARYLWTVEDIAFCIANCLGIVSEREFAKRKIGYFAKPRLFTMPEAANKIPKKRAGIYAWYFDEIPSRVLPAMLIKCVKINDGKWACSYFENDRIWSLLYIGISHNNLSARFGQHISGNAEGSTLRMKLGCLLGFELMRKGMFRKHYTFGKEKEKSLSEWMYEHARIAWIVDSKPEELETECLRRYSLPLNSEGNEGHPFHDELANIIRCAKAK